MTIENNELDQAQIEAAKSVAAVGDGADDGQNRSQEADKSEDMGGAETAVSGVPRLGFSVGGIYPYQFIDDTMHVQWHMPYTHAVVRHIWMDSKARRCTRIVANILRSHFDTDDTLLARAKAMAEAMREELCPWMKEDGEQP